LEFGTLPTAAAPARMTYSGETSTFQVTKGECKAYGACVCTSNYDDKCEKFGPARCDPYKSWIDECRYANDEECDIKYDDKYAGSMLSATAFDTEDGYDKLTVNDGALTFQGGTGPSGIVLKKGGKMGWTSDVSVTKSGWVLCMEDAPCGLNEYREVIGGACKAVEACPEDVRGDDAVEGGKPPVACREASALVHYFEHHADAPKCIAFEGDLILSNYQVDSMLKTYPTCEPLCDLVNSVFEHLATVAGAADKPCTPSGAGCPGGNVLVNVFDAKELTLDKLTSIEGDLKVTDNPYLKELSMKKLEDVGGDVVVQGPLETVSMDELTNVGGDLLVTISLPPPWLVPHSLSTLSVTLSMKNLRSVGGKLHVKMGEDVCGGPDKDATPELIACVNELFG
jgi:hypothetical protein